MAEIERIQPGDMEIWRTAMDSVQHNELLGAVMKVGENESAMKGALIRPPTDGLPSLDDGGDRLLRPSLVSADLSRAAIIAHNQSVDPKDRIPEDSTLPDLSAYQRTGTQFHNDGYGNDSPEKKRVPLSVNIQILGRVAIGLLRLETFDPDELEQLNQKLTMERSDLSSGDRVLKPEYDSPDRTIVAQPGDITAFSGMADVGEQRYATGHQFISLGDTEAERAKRTSAIVTELNGDFSRSSVEQLKAA